VKTVIGLGNPGEQYEHTPHNAGFAVVNTLTDRLSCSLRNSGRFQARIGKVVLEDVGPVLFVEPQTYMNNSGHAVAVVLRYHGVQPSDMVVVVDDADLPMGRLRIREKGGSGGHRGLDSVIESCGTEDFTRMRIGIGRMRASGEGGLVDHVLSPFSAQERAWMTRVVDQAAEAVLMILRAGTQAAMNRFNGPVVPAETQDEGSGADLTGKREGINTGHRTGEQSH
jgi:peptidyl-tRNA hydrolase, PTH1 family